MDALLQTALQAADAAARVHMRHFRKIDVEDAQEKGKSDFVTRVDREAQEAALSVIRKVFPEHHVLAEEEEQPEEASMPGTRRQHGRDWPGEGGYLWIVDPLDGTTNFLHGHPMFGASVGVGREAVMEAGAVVAPALGDRWWARRGEGAWKNGRAVRVSKLRDLRKALVGTGFPFKAPELIDRYVRELGRVLRATGGVRRGGSAALDFCYLSEGILDAFWEEDYLSPWDTAAGQVILAEAGGLVTRLDGSAVDLEDGSYLAANSRELLEGLRGLVH
ncbi:MAG: inositol monophosphatase family protein [Longimicrobiales bacterium]